LYKELKVEELPGLERSVNLALVQKIPQSLFEGLQEVAIDYHDQAYYGKSEQGEGLWVRAEAKAGTTRVYRVATLYVILQGLRFTLAIKFVSFTDTNKSVLKFLLKRLKELQIKARRLYLDRGFASVQVIKYLRGGNQSAIIACPIRGKRGGVKALCVGRRSYLTTHTFASQKEGKATVAVAVVRSFTSAKRRKIKPKKGQWLVYILINCEMKPEQIKKKYRQRFGIETSYRCSRSVRGWTSSKNAAYRYLLIGLSFFLLNVWIELRWVWARQPRRGRRLLIEAHFRLRRFAKFIAHALENLYGKVCHIESLSQVNAYG
jgi:hypothetical protein